MNTLFDLNERTERLPVARLNDWSTRQAELSRWNRLTEEEKVAMSAEFKPGMRVRNAQGEVLTVGAKSESIPEMVGCLDADGRLAIHYPWAIEPA